MSRRNHSDENEIDSDVDFQCPRPTRPRKGNGAEHQGKRGKDTCKPWTQEENELLIKAVNSLMPKDNPDDINWSEVAERVPDRSGKQCREKWRNDLRPNISKKPWTLKEEYVLVMAHARHGNRWSDVAQYLPTRPENSIKNRWYATTRARAEVKLRTFLFVYADLIERQGWAPGGAAVDHARELYEALPGGCVPLEDFQVPVDFYVKPAAGGAAKADSDKRPEIAIVGRGKGRPPVVTGGAPAAAAAAGAGRAGKRGGEKATVAAAARAVGKPKRKAAAAAAGDGDSSSGGGGVAMEGDASCYVQVGGGSMRLPMGVEAEAEAEASDGSADGLDTPPAASPLGSARTPRQQLSNKRRSPEAPSDLFGAFEAMEALGAGAADDGSPRSRRSRGSSRDSGADTVHAGYGGELQGILGGDACQQQWPSQQPQLQQPRQQELLPPQQPAARQGGGGGGAGMGLDPELLWQTAVESFSESLVQRVRRMSTGRLSAGGAFRLSAGGAGGGFRLSFGGAGDGAGLSSGGSHGTAASTPYGLRLSAGGAGGGGQSLLLPFLQRRLTGSGGGAMPGGDLTALLNGVDDDGAMLCGELDADLMALADGFDIASLSALAGAGQDALGGSEVDGGTLNHSALGSLAEDVWASPLQPLQQQQQLREQHQQQQAPPSPMPQAKAEPSTPRSREHEHTLSPPPSALPFSLPPSRQDGLPHPFFNSPQSLSPQLLQPQPLPTQLSEPLPQPQLQYAGQYPASVAAGGSLNHVQPQPHPYPQSRLYTHNSAHIPFGSSQLHPLSLLQQQQQQRHAFSVGSGLAAGQCGGHAVAYGMQAMQPMQPAAQSLPMSLPSPREPLSHEPLMLVPQGAEGYPERQATATATATATAVSSLQLQSSLPAATQPLPLTQLEPQLQSRASSSATRLSDLQQQQQLQSAQQQQQQASEQMDQQRLQYGLPASNDAFGAVGGSLSFPYPCGANPRVGVPHGMGTLPPPHVLRSRAAAFYGGAAAPGLPPALYTGAPAGAGAGAPLPGLGAPECRPVSPGLASGAGPQEPTSPNSAAAPPPYMQPVHMPYGGAAPPPYMPMRGPYYGPAGARPGVPSRRMVPYPMAAYPHPHALPGYGGPALPHPHAAAPAQQPEQPPPPTDGTAPSSAALGAASGLALAANDAAQQPLGHPVPPPYPGPMYPGYYGRRGHWAHAPWPYPPYGAPLHAHPHPHVRGPYPYYTLPHAGGPDTTVLSGGASGGDGVSGSSGGAAASAAAAPPATSSSGERAQVSGGSGCDETMVGSGPAALGAEAAAGAGWPFCEGRNSSTVITTGPAPVAGC